MLTSLALIFLVGLAAAGICQLLKLPRILGMLAVGIILGPYVWNFLDSSILGISADLRQMALIIILIKAGLSLNLSDLKKVGRPAVLMSFVPASFEILAYVLFAPAILGITRIEAAVMGAVLGAVSPAVVIPRMVQLMEENYGTEKSIPQMILAGASCDDIFVIVLFTTFTGMCQGGQIQMSEFVKIPLSILAGVLLGGIAGWFLVQFFETAYARNHYVRNSMKVLIVLGTAFLLAAAEDWLEGVIPVSGLLAVVSMACVLKMKSTGFVSRRLSEKFGKLWLAAEVMLFVLVGAAVDIRYMAQAGFLAVIMIVLALIIRAGWSMVVPAGNEFKWKRAVVFCNCLCSESNRSGSHRVGSAGNGTAMRKYCAVSGCACDYYYSASWRAGNGLYLSASAGKGRMIAFS